jgi:hypothetical protein
MESSEKAQHTSWKELQDNRTLGAGFEKRGQRGEQEPAPERMGQVAKQKRGPVREEPVGEHRTQVSGQQKTHRCNFAEAPTDNLGKQLKLERGELRTTERAHCFEQSIQVRHIRVHPLGLEGPEKGQGRGQVAPQKSRAAGSLPRSAEKKPGRHHLWHSSLPTTI